MSLVAASLQLRKASSPGSAIISPPPAARTLSLIPAAKPIPKTIDRPTIMGALTRHLNRCDAAPRKALRPRGSPPTPTLHTMSTLLELLTTPKGQLTTYATNDPPVKTPLQKH